MVKKFTLTVPDTLAEKIEARRDGLGNLSSLFQEAVGGKIRKLEDYERRIAQGESMEAKIERLRAEKAAAENDYHDAGVKCGIEWAGNSSYTDLQYMRAFDPIEPHQGRYYYRSIVTDDTLGEGFQGEFTGDPVLAKVDDMGALGEIFTRWFEGWKEGVEMFWVEVEGKI